MIPYMTLPRSPGRLKFTAWLCLQVFSAGASVITPLAHAAASSGSATQRLSQESLTNLPVQPYILREGETPASVAASFGLTLSQLQSLNQFRTFRVPFAHLITGDEIDVPSAKTMRMLQPLTAIAATPPLDNTYNQQNEKEKSTSAAQRVRTLGNLLENSGNSGAAAGMARSLTTGAANDAVQQWLGQFGTVQAQLNLDENNSLANSSLDWLVPLYDSPQNMFFTQTGVRNKNGRNTLNLGWGCKRPPRSGCLVLTIFLTTTSPAITAG